MANLKLKAYEIFKARLGADEAEIVIDYIESKTEKPADPSLTRRSVKGGLPNAATGVITAVYLVGFLQFLAFIGSVLILLIFFKK